MNLEGDLQTTPLQNVMLSVSALSGSGILTIQGDDDIVAVSFLNGAIVTADALNQTVEEGLGKVLQGRGLIAREDFDAVVRDHQGGSTGSLGDMLVQRNLINRDELLEALRLQTSDLMLMLLSWRSGEYKFYSGDEVSFEAGFVPISVEELLTRGVQELGERAGLFGELPDTGAVYRQVPPRGDVQILGRDGDSMAGGIWINQDQADLVARLDGKVTSETAAASLGMPQHKLQFGLYHLQQYDLIELIVAAGKGKGARPKAASAPAPSLAQTPIRAPQSAPALDSIGPQMGGGGASLPDLADVMRPSSPTPSSVPTPSASLSGQETSGAGLQAEIFMPPDPDDVVDEELRFEEPKSTQSASVFVLNAIGPALAALLLVGIALGLTSRPVSLLLPFPWQQNQRSTVERQIRDSMFLRLDRSTRTYFLMEAHYPDSLDELHQLGLMTEEQIMDPSRYSMVYSNHELSYRISLRRRGELAEGLGTTEAITGDFLVDPQFIRSAASAEAPLVLLD